MTVMICEVQGRVEGLGGGSLSGPICCAGRSLGRDDVGNRRCALAAAQASKSEKSERSTYASEGPNGSGTGTVVFQNTPHRRTYTRATRSQP